MTRDRSRTKLNRPCIHRKVTRCQSLSHIITSPLMRGGQVLGSPISRSEVERTEARRAMTVSIDWSCNPGRFSVGNEFERNNGLGSFGKPCVICESSTYYSRQIGFTYVDEQVFHRESRFGRHLDLQSILILEAEGASQSPIPRHEEARRTCRRPLGCTRLLLVSSLVPFPGRHWAQRYPP